MIAIIVIIAAWCMILRRCKMNGGENAIPTAPQPSGALPPPLTVPQPTAPSMSTNPAPPTDIELALFRMQERQRHLHHLHQQQQQKEMQR